MERYDQYFEAVANEGYRPERSGPQVISFKREGLRFGLFVPDGTSETFTMLYHYAGIDRDLADEDYLRAASLVNAKSRGIKLWVDVDESEVTVAYEAFYLEVGAFAPFLNNLLSDIHLATIDYFEVLEELQGEEAEKTDDLPDEAGDALGRRFTEDVPEDDLCYCRLSDFEILRDINQANVPSGALTKLCCWKRICRVRGRNFRAVSAEKWRQLCAKRGRLF